MPKCRNCDYDVHPSIGQCPHCGTPMDNPSADLEQQVAWRSQAMAEVNISDRAPQRAAQLARDADLRIMTPKSRA